MMPKSTATSRPVSSRNRLPGCMSAWKKPSRSAWRRKLWITLRPRSGRSTCACASRTWSLSAMPSIHSIVSTLWVVRSQSTVGTRKSGSSRVFSAISDSAAASSRRSISIVTERDIVLMTSISRSRRASAECVSALCATKKKSARSRRKRAATFGRSTLTATGAHAVALDLAAMHLRDRGGGDRGAEARKRLRHRAFQRGRDDGFGLGLRERRQAVLQAFQVARHEHADHVGPCGKELAELEISGPEPRQRARQPRAAIRRRGARPAG